MLEIVRKGVGLVVLSSSIIATTTKLQAQSQGSSALERIVSVNIYNEPPKEMLDLIGKQANVVFSYSPKILENRPPVTVAAERQPIRLVLFTAFGETVKMKSHGKYIILTDNRTALSKPFGDKPQVIQGYITNPKTGEGIRNATVYDQKLLLSAITDEYGYFKMEVPYGEMSKQLQVKKMGFADTTIVPNNNSSSFVLLKLPATALDHLKDISKKGENFILKTVPHWLMSDRQKTNTINVGDTIYRNWQVSLLPYIGTNRQLSGNVVNKYSYNIFAGYSMGVRVFEVSSLVNIVRADARYVMIGAVNYVGGNTKGVQIGNIFNRTQSVTGVQIGNVFNLATGNVTGAQLAGVFSMTHATLKGAQISGVLSVADTVKGAQISAVYSNAHYLNGTQVSGILNNANGTAVPCQLSAAINILNGNITGLQTSGVMNISKKVSGAQVTGVMNLASIVKGEQIGGVYNQANTLNGVQVSGVTNIAGRSNGSGQVSGVLNILNGDGTIQVAGAANIARSIHGVQIAGIYNQADTVAGVQVGAVLNKAKVMKGVQLGLINIADTISGIPIGLFSFVKKGYHHIEASGDELFYTNVAFRTGTPLFHNIITAGSRTLNKGGDDLWTVGYGLGTTLSMGKKWSFDADITSNTIAVNDQLEDNNKLYKLYLGFDRKLSKHVSVALGVTANYFDYKDSEVEDGKMLSSMIPYTLWNTQQENGRTSCGWIGAKLGIRF
ncbi:hypothetical protein [uncultured Acetobacteroides sp.]|uniref:hypothetical protein n=1 Tax=uncultured Acetobacteroides sp. TaxID=1760811 RepID=UPI0029F52662|nr:hypothetical protein [uncultured Acetobacteroides sp.]